MSTTVRTVGVSLLVAVAAGTSVGAALVLGSPGAGSASATSPQVIAQAFVVGAMASVFIALPLGVVGGLVAAWAVQRRSHQLNTSYWVGRGLLSGLTIGAGGCVLYVFALGGLSPDPAALVFYVVVGAASGAACGLIVGLWCAHTAKQLH